MANGVVGGKEALKHLTYSTVVRATILAGAAARRACRGRPRRGHGVLVPARDGLSRRVSTSSGIVAWRNVISSQSLSGITSERQQEQGAKELFRLLQEQDPPLFKWWTETVRAHLLDGKSGC